jgi:aspartate/methionine/tyrosine aminotransferase
VSEQAAPPTLPKPSAVVAAMPRSGIRAIVELAEGRDDVVNLGFGEPDFDTPAHVVEAAARAAREGRTRYTPSRGIAPLREACAARLPARPLGPVRTEEIVVTVGGAGALFSTLATIAERGSRILVPDPCWPNYVGHCALLELDAVRYPLDPALGFEPDLDALEALAPGATAVVINTPANPTGAVWRRETVAACMELARRHGLYVIADEVYDELAFDGEHASALPLDEDGRVIGIFSFSKTYAMTGWRVGYLAAPPALAPLLGKVPESVWSCPTAPAQWAAFAALDGPQDCVAEMRAAYRERRDLVVRLLRDNGLHVAEPRGAFYALADVRRSGEPTLDLARRLVLDHGVVCAPGSTFGPSGEGFLRLSLAASPAVIEEGVRRIVAALG